MRRWIGATLAFTVAVGGLTAAWIVVDRRDAIAARQQVLQSLARIMAAHGQAVVGDAAKIVQALDDTVAGWDLREPQAGQAIHAQLQKLLLGSPQLSSAWVLDANGVNVVDSWSYPARAVEGGDRPYFLKHKAGHKGPLVSADPRPGAITGRERFTYSLDQRHPDGALKSVLVVGIYSEQFAALYGEAANWTDGTAGFYTADGQALAQRRGPNLLAPAFVERIVARGQGNGSSADILSDGGQDRLVAWAHTSDEAGLLTTTSQPLASVLADWRDRSLLLAGVAFVLIGGFAAFAYNARRLERVRNDAALKDLALREVHHRVKNALQLMVSLIELRGRAHQSHAVKDELREVSSRLQAVAQVHDLLQQAALLETIDLNELLTALYDHLSRTWHGVLKLRLGPSVTLDTDTGSTVAIIANELLTNAMKYARGRVKVKSKVRDGTLILSVRNDGEPLPPDFRLDASKRFGLRSALLMCDRIDATLSASEGLEAGAVFTLTVPLRPARA